MLKINSILNKVLIFFILILISSNNTLGFDLYHHVLSAQTLDSINSLNLHYEINGFKIPRYLLFHYLAYLWNYTGLGLIFFNNIIYFIIISDIIKNISGYNFLVQFTITLFILLTVFYWSPISTIIVALINYFTTKNNLIKNISRFIIVCFHPVGLVISIILFLFKDRYLLYYLLSTFIVMGLLQNYIYADTGYCRISSDIDLLNSFDFLFDKFLSSKLKEIIIVVLTLSLLYFSKITAITLLKYKIKGLKIYGFFLSLLITSSLFLTSFSIVTEKRNIFNISKMSNNEKMILKMGYLKSNKDFKDICYFAKYFK